MGNSIRTTSKTTTPTLATKQAIFAIGDVVLCPSLSSEPFTLIADQYGQRDLLSLTHDGSYFYYDEQGYFVPASDTETGDYRPNLFHDTPSNRQAIATLYSNASTTQSSQRKVIDITEADDDEVILISSVELSDTACDIGGAIGLLNDVGMLLWMIYQEKMTPSQAASMARLSHDSTDTWADLLSSRLNTINKSLAQTTFGTEVSA
ncbi:hypothetical protein IQ457_05175 [Psychrobacter sp. M9-54-1]|uniref:hypothetical protein n=1 Tax=unclassified Psychrobacter TaxID=196806 RepID=UPI00190D742F|nr:MULTISPECIES: hypothetical protein [unclassified Psychrobacter]MBK3393337.1 hypothetical protein [Psychrobacter sp. M9-54-1]